MYANKIHAKVVTKKINEESNEWSMYIDLLKGKKVVKRISCEAKNNDKYAKCYPVELLNGNLFIVDCYTHDSIAMSCEISMYNNKGEIDNNFKSPFMPLKRGVWGFQNRIDLIEKAVKSKDQKNQVEITGWFQYEELDKIPDYQRDFCIEEDCVSFNGYSTKAKLTIDSKGQVVKTKIIKRAQITYKKEQIIKELKQQIPSFEENLKNVSGQEADYYKDKLKKYKSWLKKIE
ncbi:MAG: hypothetical protein AABY64_05395 [Bdellovibrionota bacterium]